MNILMVLDHTYPPDQRVENEAESLVDAGHNVTVLSFADDNRCKRDNYRGVDIVRVQIRNSIQKKLRGAVSFLDLYSNIIFKAIKNLWEESPFDAIHVHDLYLGRVGLKVKMKFNVPLIIDLHENYVHALSQYAWSSRFPGNFLISIKKWERLEKEWIHKSDGVITVISDMKDRYINQGFLEDKFIIVPNTPKISTFRQFVLKDKILKTTYNTTTPIRNTYNPLYYNIVEYLLSELYFTENTSTQYNLNNILTKIKNIKSLSDIDEIIDNDLYNLCITAKSQKCINIVESNDLDIYYRKAINCINIIFVILLGFYVI